MDHRPYVVITGAAGFIGSAMLAQLNASRQFAPSKSLVLVDDFSREDKLRNLEDKSYALKIARQDFPAWLEQNAASVDLLLHIGARTDTAEFDRSVFERWNSGYSRHLWKSCAQNGIALIYASSAATYGDGSQGYGDDHAGIPSLKPLNPYGDSKQEFDVWALAQEQKPPFWAGLKFFNVYGPNEYHKGRMASVIFHAFHQIKESGSVRLFRSHKAGFADGEQRRDFVYIRDVIGVLEWLMHTRSSSGIYNLGSGQARTFLDLARAVFSAMKVPESIEFIDMPEDIRDTYQYHTEAPMNKLRDAGYREAFYSLEEGVEDYVQQFLLPDRVL